MSQEGLCSRELVISSSVTVTSAITPVSLTLIRYNAVEYVHAVCITRTFAYASCLLRDFSNTCEDIRLDDRPNFFLI